MRSLKLRTGLSEKDNGQKLSEKDEKASLIIQAAIARFCKNPEYVRALA